MAGQGPAEPWRRRLFVAGVTGGVTSGVWGVGGREWLRVQKRERILQLRWRALIFMRGFVGPGDRHSRSIDVDLSLVICLYCSYCLC